MLRHLRTFSSVATVAIVAALALSASALADIRYASPTGVASSSSGCLELAPCSLTGALDADETDPGDEVILSPGDYTVNSGLSAGDLASVRGTGLPSQTRIFSTSTNDAFTLYSMAGTSVLSDIEIVASTNASSKALTVLGGIVRRVIARNTTGKGCDFEVVRVTDSVCATSASGAAAITIDSGGVLTPILRNVTAVATSPAGGIGIDVVGYSSSNITISAKSVIARGQTADIKTTQPAGGSVEVALSHSNYATTDVTANGSVTPAGTDSNQTAAPIFVDAANGDFRQAPSSPTIDAGIADIESGTTDLFSAARLQGAGVDIGAHERAKPAAEPTPPAADTRAPIAKFKSKPKKTTTKRKARFTFSADEPATFQCKLDRGKFRPCKSPFTKTVRRGKHTLTVVPTDQAGNKGKPVKASWNVKPIKR